MDTVTGNYMEFATKIPELITIFIYLYKNMDFQLDQLFKIQIKDTIKKCLL